MSMHYDCSSAPAPEDVKFLCDLCRQVLEDNGYAVENAGGLGKGKCAHCLRRRMGYPVRIRKAVKG